MRGASSIAGYLLFDQSIHYLFFLSFLPIVLCVTHILFGFLSFFFARMITNASFNLNQFLTPFFSFRFMVMRGYISQM